MGTARSPLFTISSILLILAGIGSMICAAFLFKDRINTSGSSVPLTFLGTALMLIFSIMNIISGINGVRNHNKRISSALVIRLPEISIAICVLSIALTLFNGILAGYMLILACSGIVIPLLFIFAAARKSNR